MMDEQADECWCSYGYFHGGDPRQWVPDEEMNAPGEIAAWLALCEAWERGEQEEPAGEEHGPWFDQETGAVTLGDRPEGAVVGVCHAPRSFGIGSSYCSLHPIPADAWKSYAAPPAGGRAGEER